MKKALLFIHRMLCVIIYIVVALQYIALDCFAGWKQPTIYQLAEAFSDFVYRGQTYATLWHLIINKPGWSYDDEFEPDLPDFEPCDYCTQPDACADFECAIKAGIQKQHSGIY